MKTSVHNGSRTKEITRDVINAMVEADYNNSQISQELSVSPQTVTAVKNSLDLPSSALVVSLKKRLGDKFAVKADNLLDAIDQAKLDKMSGYQLMIAAATAVDKMLLLDGKPTQIHAVALFQQVRDDQAALRNELDYMKDAIDVPADVV